MQRVEPEGGESSAQLPSPMLFDPSSGEFTTIDSPEIPAGTELVEAGCLPSGTAENPSVTYRLVLRTPSQGLDPGGGLLMLGAGLVIALVLAPVVAATAIRIALN